MVVDFRPLSPSDPISHGSRTGQSPAKPAKIVPFSRKETPAEPALKVVELPPTTKKSPATEEEVTAMLSQIRQAIEQDPAGARAAFRTPEALRLLSLLLD